MQQKAQKAYKQTKTKKTMLYAHKKHLRGKKSLIRLFAFLYFSLSVLVLFVLLLGCLFVLCPWNLFVKKIRFKTAPMIIYITTLEPNDVRKTNNGKKPKNIEKSVVALLFWRYKCWAVTYGWGDGGGGGGGGVGGGGGRGGGGVLFHLEYVQVL